MRIGIGEASWIGSFEAGSDAISFNTVALMPDGKQLFVSADGAGYIIDLQSRTLVEQIGTEVAGLMADKLRTLFVVVHAGRRLEAFGRDGRLWKTGAIGSERIRHMDLADTTIIGEGVHPLLPGWTDFTVAGDGQRAFPSALTAREYRRVWRPSSWHINGCACSPYFFLLRCPASTTNEAAFGKINGVCS